MMNTADTTRVGATSIAIAIAVTTLMIALTACDSSSDFEECSGDLAAAEGSQRNKCAPSTFKAEDYRAREVSGVVRRGADTVVGALVRVEPWQELPLTKSSSVVTTVTDSVGFFGGLRPIALRYDITARLGSDVVVFRGVASRYVEPSIENGTHKFPRGWTSRINVTLDTPLRSDRAVAFFANGDGIFGLAGDLINGFDVVSRDFTSTASVHAIEYVKGAGLDTATGYAKLDVGISGSAPTSAVMHLDPITEHAEPSFAIKVPPGFPTPTTVDVIIGYTPENDAHLATVPIGIKTKLPIIPNGGYLYRARSTAPDGAISDSGEILFDVYAPVTSIVIPAPPELESASTSIAATEPLVATGRGVLEHVLTPTPDDVPTSIAAETRGAVRIIVKQHEARLPNLATLGLPVLQGNYTWTVRSYESLRFVEELSGQDVRRYRSMSVSKPRAIVIR